MSGSDLVAMDLWLRNHGASGLTFAGVFLDFTLNPAWNVPRELDPAWNNGFVPFINLTPSSTIATCKTASQIASGSCDAYLRDFADLYKAWAGSTKYAFLAPLQEMNSPWTLYGGDAAGYKGAIQRMRQIFTERGVPAGSVRWVSSGQPPRL